MFSCFITLNIGASVSKATYRPRPGVGVRVGVAPPPKKKNKKKINTVMFFKKNALSGSSQLLHKWRPASPCKMQK